MMYYPFLIFVVLGLLAMVAANDDSVSNGVRLAAFIFGLMFWLLALALCVNAVARHIVGVWQ